MSVCVGFDFQPRKWWACICMSVFLRSILHTQLKYELVFRFCSTSIHWCTDTGTFNVYPLYDFPSLACVSHHCTKWSTFIPRIYKTLFVFISCANVYIIIADKLIFGLSSNVKCVEKNERTNEHTSSYFFPHRSISLVIWLLCVYDISILHLNTPFFELSKSFCTHYMSTDCIQAIKRSLVMRRCYAVLCWAACVCTSGVSVNTEHEVIK